MRQIPQRELRNQSAAILRAAEAGEEFVITVDGRPVATLSAYRPRRFVPSSRVRDLIRTPVDPQYLEDIRRHIGDRPEDPWQRTS